MTTPIDIHIQQPPEPSAQTKPPPKPSSVPAPFTYLPSPDGIDENLLILLHGLGDTQTPFARLGSQLNLPQTAILALRAPEQVPFLDEEAYQWYPSFDNLGELITNPNPTPAFDLLTKVLEHLITDCHWPSSNIHLFGFVQGGSVAVEFGIRYWRSQRPLALGSIITISGPLLSFPTFPNPCPTPLLVFHRHSSKEDSLPSDAMTGFRRAYEKVTEVRMGGVGEGMPRSKDEWEPIMGFWSEWLKRRQSDGFYEIVTGTARALAKS